MFGPRKIVAPPPPPPPQNKPAVAAPMLPISKPPPATPMPAKGFGPTTSSPQAQTNMNNILKSIGAPAPAKLMKKGGPVKSSASKRADGIAQRGKTKGKMV